MEALQPLLPVQLIKGSLVPRKVKVIFPKLKSESYFQLTLDCFDHHASVQLAGMILGMGEAMLMLFPGDTLGAVPSKLCATRSGRNNYFVAETREAFSRRILSHSKKSAVRHMKRVRHLVAQEDRNADKIVGSSFFLQQ